MVVESVVVLSESALLLQAASTPAIAKIANNFFIVLFFKIVKKSDANVTDESDINEPQGIF
jgi:hypothetical protein